MKKILFLLLLSANVYAQDTLNPFVVYDDIVVRGDTIMLPYREATRNILANLLRNPKDFDVDCWLSDSGCIIMKDVNLGNGVIAEIMLSYSMKQFRSDVPTPMLLVNFAPINREEWTGTSYSDEISWRVVDAILSNRWLTLDEAKRDKNTLLRLLSDKLR